MAVLTQLADPAGYRPCDWDLRADPAGRAYWLGHFRRHLEVLVSLIVEVYGPPPGALAAFRADYLAVYDDIESGLQDQEQVDILRLDEVRTHVLRRHGFPDPFVAVKRREDEVALALLPDVLAELDAVSPAERAVELAQNLMAGNIFDLGAWATIERYHNGTGAFHATRAGQPPRPWPVDDVDAWARAVFAGRSCPERSPSGSEGQREARGHLSYRHAVFFVDNAGSDVVLGCLPLARALVQRGTRVTLGANSAPALNDITAAELEPLLERCAAVDAVFAAALGDGRLRGGATGNGTPLLDLTRLDDGFVAATSDADLIILHGMGRAVESNWRAAFTCDVLRTAVLKDEGVAARLGARLFDCVFRFPR